MLIDKQLVAARFAKSAKTYNAEAEVQKIVAHRLLTLVRDHFAMPARRILEIGCGTGFLSRVLHASFNPDRMVLNDMCPSMREHVQDLLEHGVEFMSGDGETDHFGAGFDLIVSSSVVQWFNNPESFIARCFDALTAGGCLAIGTYGPENMREIFHLTGVGLEYKSVREWASLFGDSWRLVFVEEDILEKEFASPMDVLHHLRWTGVTGIGNYRWTAEKLRCFIQQYRRRYTLSGKMILTYHPLYMLVHTAVPKQLEQ